jgi:small subunit ribosomal protein S4e
MAKKGQRRGLKRSKAPKLWRLARKEKKWTINPHPGPHNKEAIPLAFIIRDQLGYAHTLRETKQILNERKVKVNGKVRTDFKFPVGLMDVVEIPITGDTYRVLPDRKGTLELYPVKGEEEHFRPLKITGKTLVKAGTQLQFHDGTTLILKKSSKDQGKSSYSTSGTVLYNFESRAITDYYPFSEGSFAMITGGRNVSRTGKIASVKGNMVEIEGDETFRTLKKNVFVIGARESIISLPGG